ncbi:hypothetical protein C0989_002564 [Termitomyces sp. Mn162]|nr:hypothetical protein C0989_002564 [Termitomyces sp. Mn162]
MFSRFTRLPLRRCLHTAPPPSSNRFHLTLGASATVAAYLAYRLSSHSIALDNGHPAETQSSTVAPSEPLIRPTSEKSASPITGDSDASTDVPPTASQGESSGVTTTSEGESQEGEGGSGGAFNPVTGEINWDCPCLGGMAHGPCGPQFREAFSCFVYSEDEPKGINCVEKFKAMQNCFREHPEIYADEIDDDDDEAATEPAAAQGGSQASPDTASNETHPDSPPQTTTSETPA